MKTNDGRQNLMLKLLVFGLYFTGVFAMLLFFVFTNNYNHDEGFYIATAQMLLNGHLPYLDFSCNQMPNALLLYAPFLAISNGYLLVAGRLVSALFSLLTLGLIFKIIWQQFAYPQFIKRFIPAALLTALLLLNFIFLETVAHVRNYAAAEFFALLAFWLFWRFQNHSYSYKLLFFSGLSLALAIGFRIAFVPAVAAFVVCLWFCSNSKNGAQKFRKTMVYGAGLMAGMLPSLVFFAITPRQFVYHIFTAYATADPQYRESIGWVMNRPEKWDFFIENLQQPSTFVLLVLAVSFSLSAIYSYFTARKSNLRPLLLLWLIVPLLLTPYLLRTILFDHYLFAVLPFLLLIITFSFPKKTSFFTHYVQLLGTIVVVLSFMQFYHYFPQKNNERTPHDIHRISGKIAEITGNGKILTLSPIYALEGGGSIYKELAAGVFVWRNGRYMPGSRAEMNVVTQNNLDGFLEKQPPAAILIGYESNLEEPFWVYAILHGYREKAVIENRGRVFCPDSTATTAENRQIIIDYFSRNIRQSKDWLRDIEAKAQTNGITTEVQIEKDAEWMLDNYWK